MRPHTHSPGGAGDAAILPQAPFGNVHPELSSGRDGVFLHKLGVHTTPGFTVEARSRGKATRTPTFRASSSHIASLA